MRNNRRGRINSHAIQCYANFGLKNRGPCSPEIQLFHNCSLLIKHRTVYSGQVGASSKRTEREVEMKGPDVRKLKKFITVKLINQTPLSLN